tara:strand:- start:7665 stop:8075 length:411 start_codon:yes stop_codon:yes gene_type:complete
MKNFLYFRNVTTLAADDAIEDSACFPYDSLLGVHPVSDTSIRLTFEPIQRPRGANTTLVVDNAANLPLVDTVVVNITANQGREVMQAIIGACNASLSDGLIVIADDAADQNGGAKYLASNITSCGTIVHNAAYVNS